MFKERSITMKHLLKASMVCWAIVIALLVWGLYGCAPKSPEFRAAYDVHGRVYHLAAQVREADRESKADQVRAGERFYANCDTYSRTIAELLISDHGADPADVWLARVSQKRKGMWIARSNTVHLPVEHHQIVIYKGYVIDNRWRAVLSVKDLEWEYHFGLAQNMQDQAWARYAPWAKP
jgi:hypothetical protein